MVSKDSVIILSKEDTNILIGPEITPSEKSSYCGIKANLATYLKTMRNANESITTRVRILLFLFSLLL
ncbi:hypothetical protein BDZ91DRAFT_716493 [Kalaharituber pfeilii]|nr:hypothetical protein BDZ91DRAFT_716493 [Kalaharituber pfeilii]